MVKKHSTKTKILIHLLNNKRNKFTIRAISKAVKIDYKTVYMNVNELIKDNTIVSEKAGQTTLCTINFKNFNEDMFTAEFVRTKSILKNSNFYSMMSYFSEIRPFYIMLLFGSFASGKQHKNSDIDIMVISDNEDIKKRFNDQIRLIPLKIHYLEFSSNDFIRMLKTNEFTVVREAFLNNIILSGIENYYELVKNA